MAIALDIYFDPRPLEAFKANFATNTILAASTRAASKAGGDAIRKVRVESRKIISEKKTVRARTINKGLPTKRYGSVRSLDSLKWEMRVSGKALPVASYPNARQTKKGVTVSINRGKRTLIKSAFIRTTRSGYTGVFLRRKDQANKLRNTLTTRLSDAYSDKDVRPRITQFGQSTFAASFGRLITLELAKLKR